VPAPGLDAAQQQLSRDMIAYWTSFARTGRPSARGTPAWARYRTDTDTVQSLEPPRPLPDAGFAVDHHCAFWDALRQ
jgi:para-nitrobenzyl esterase